MPDPEGIEAHSPGSPRSGAPRVAETKSDPDPAGIAASQLFKIARIEFDLSEGQHFEQFIARTSRAMVFFLMVDVRTHAAAIARSDRESCISHLPGKIGLLDFRVYPFRRGLL